MTFKCTTKQFKSNAIETDRVDFIVHVKSLHIVAVAVDNVAATGTAVVVIVHVACYQNIPHDEQPQYTCVDTNFRFNVTFTEADRHLSHEWTKLYVHMYV